MSSGNISPNTEQAAENASAKFNQKPKRPMTAYNFFFQEERRRILDGEDPETAFAIQASKTNGSSTGLSSSRKRSKSICNASKNAADDTRGRKRSSDEMISEESITFEGLGRIIGKRWKKLKEKGAISKYTELAKKASKKYKEDIKKFYDEEMESMLRVGRSFETVPVSGLQTQNNQSINSNQTNAIRDLSVHLNLLNNQVDANCFNYSSRNVVITPDLELAPPQPNIPLPSTIQNGHQASNLLQHKPEFSIASEGNDSDKSNFNSHSDAQGYHAIPNTLSFEAQSQILNNSNVFLENSHLLMNDSAQPSPQNTNIYLNNLLSSLNGSSPSFATGYDAVSLLLEELQRSQKS